MEAATARFRQPAGTRISGALHRLASDRRLIERYCAGDDGAFAALHERHRARVLAICMGVLGAKEDAEDAAQEAFASAAAQLRRRPPQEFRPWIARVARNAAIDAVRARRSNSQLDEQVAGGVEPSADLAARGDFEELMAGLRTLPESQRSALVLRELAGYSYLEIAATMELDETAVRGLISRARIGLRKHLEAQNVECVQIRERLAAELDGRRRPSEVRRHLRTCSGCREFRRAARADSRALRSLVPLPLGLVGLLGSLAALRTPSAGVVGAGLIAKTSAGTKAVSVGVACAVSLCTVEGARELGAAGLPDIPAGIVQAAEEATGVSHPSRPGASQATAGAAVSPAGQDLVKHRRHSLAASGPAVLEGTSAERRRTDREQTVLPADNARGRSEDRDGVRETASRRHGEGGFPLGGEGDSHRRDHRSFGERSGGDGSGHHGRRGGEDTRGADTFYGGERSRPATGDEPIQPSGARPERFGGDSGSGPMPRGRSGPGSGSVEGQPQGYSGPGPAASGDFIQPEGSAAGDVTPAAASSEPATEAQPAQ